MNVKKLFWTHNLIFFYQAFRLNEKIGKTFQRYV